MTNVEITFVIVKKSLAKMKSFFSLIKRTMSKKYKSLVKNNITAIILVLLFIINTQLIFII
ncbi:hypothetical protein GCM10027442_14750 [Emticicia fontis]